MKSWSCNERSVRLYVQQVWVNGASLPPQHSTARRIAKLLTRRLLLNVINVPSRQSYHLLVVLAFALQA